MVSVFTSGYVNTETILHFFIIIVVIIIFYVVWSNLKKTILCSCTYLQQEFDSELKVVQVPWTAPKEETT